MGRSKSSRTRLIFAAIVAAWIAHDLLVPPRYAFDARATVAAIDEYRVFVSPHLRGVVQCRFTPTCSQYAIDAVRSRGAIAGSWLAAKRICRCHPFGSCGHDPVPKSGKRKAESGNILEHAT